jgi:hypothetical protein
MSNNPIPHDVIVQSFFWAGTPRQVAEFLSRWYGYYLKPIALTAVWEAEAETNFLLRTERPTNGFGYLRPDEAALLARIVSAGAELAHGKTRSEHAGSSS